MRARALAKRMLPAALRRWLRAPQRYADRLRIWRAIAREIAGTDAASVAALGRSRGRARLTALAGLDEWRDPVLLDAAVVTVAGVGRFALAPHSDELYIVLPAREPAVHSALRALLRPGEVFVDAGANIGVFSVAATTLVGPGGRVIAIEMTPPTAERLRTNLALNGAENVTVIEAALGERSGETVEGAIQRGHAGRATLTAADTLTDPVRFQVETQTLDDILAPHPRVALMKIDIEGAELAALHGAGNALDRIDAIVFEALDGDRAVATFLGSRGFAVERLDHHNFLARRAGRG